MEDTYIQQKSNFVIHESIWHTCVFFFFFETVHMHGFDDDLSACKAIKVAGC